MTAHRPEGPSERKGEEAKKPEPAKEFDLWRILTTPEELLEESERAAPVASAEQAPAAVTEELPAKVAEETVVYCRNHPDDPAIAQCPICAAYYCNGCLIIKRGRLLCKTCAETLYAPTEEEIIERGEEAYQSRGDFLPVPPPEFNPLGAGPGGEGRLANGFKRLCAFVLDIALARLLYIVSYVVLTFLLAGLSRGAVPSVYHLGNGDVMEGIKIVASSLFGYPFLFIAMALDFLYFFISYAMANRTPGMSWLNLRIVSTYGDFAGLGACALRAAVLTATLGFSIIVALVHPRGLGLHDMAAGTYEINYSGLKRVDVYETINVKLD